MKTKRTRNSKSAWITTFLKKRMNCRDRLKRKAIKTNDPSVWNQFRSIRNQVNRDIKTAKQDYYKNAFRNCSGHKGPAQCVCVADCYYIVNALDLPFASPIAIYR